MVEREEKFLVDPDRFPYQKTPGVRVFHIEQGYGATYRGPGSFEVRIRVKSPLSDPAPTERDTRRFLTFKKPLKEASPDGTGSTGGPSVREEIEIELTQSQVDQIWPHLDWTFTKNRYTGGPVGRWEVDQFLTGPLKDLWVAEYELGPEEELPDLPEWIVRDDQGPVRLTQLPINLIAAGILSTEGIEGVWNGAPDPEPPSPDLGGREYKMFAPLRGRPVPVRDSNKKGTY